MCISLQTMLSSSFKNPSEMGSELLVWAWVDVTNAFLWNILFCFDFYRKLYIAVINTVPFSSFQNCFAILEDKIYSFPFYFLSQLCFEVA